MKYFFPLLAAFFLLTSPAIAKERSIAVTDNTAIFLPIATDWGVNLVVEKVDGKPTKFGLYDSVLVDAGDRTLEVRLEYKPAGGSSVLVGGLANLLLRAATNKTFRTTLEIEVEGGKEYQMTAVAKGEKLEIAVINHSDEEIVKSQVFEVKEGKFERIF